MSNVRNGLRARFDRVVVVATDEEARRKIEQALAKAGLVISRIEIRKEGGRQ